MAYLLQFIVEFARIVGVGKTWIDKTAKVGIISLLTIAGIGVFTLGREWNMVITRDSETMITLGFWPVVYSVALLVAIVAAVVQTRHSIPRMKFVAEGMRNGELLGVPPCLHWSIAIKNTSLIRSIKKPVVRCWVQSEQTEISNMPVLLHQKGDRWDEHVKRPDIEPGCTAIFDILIHRGDSWQVPGESLTDSPVCIAPREYEIFLQASAEDMPSTKMHRVGVRMYLEKNGFIPVLCGVPVPVKQREKKG
jgi:hypothetical protein